MTAYAVFLLAGLGTYVARALFITVVGERRLPDRIELGLRNIGPAVLAALTASLLTSDGVIDYVTNVPEVVASILAVVTSWVTRRYVVSFVVAMAALWTLQWLL